MIRKLLTTCAVVTLLSSGLLVSGAHSEDATKPANATKTATTAPVAVPDGNLVSKIMGAAVYNSAADDAEKIGDVKDIVLTKDGKAQFIIIGVGGFLGIGEKNVAYDFSKAEWAEKNGSRWLVAKTTKEDLKAQPNFDTKAYDRVAAAPGVPAAAATDKTATAAIDKSTLSELPVDKISAQNLIGTTVYGADDAKVGEISDVVLTTDKKVDAIVVDVGGFLGIGEKSVAVGMEKLKFMTDNNGNRYLYTNLTKAQLEAQVAYDKGTYAQNRDQQRVIVNP